MLWARVLADAVVVFHAAFVAYVVLGMAAIVIGIVMRGGWVRTPWFRWTHLAAIGVVVLETLGGVACPLTTWEGALRRRSGQTGYTGDFVGYWAHRLIFFEVKPWVFTAGYLAFGAAVLLAFVLAPPRVADASRFRDHLNTYRVGQRRRNPPSCRGLEVVGCAPLTHPM